jgi:hypothetical protein
MLRLSFFLRVSEACHSSENMREVRTATDMLPPVQSSSGYGSTRPERSCPASSADPLFPTASGSTKSTSPWSEGWACLARDCSSGLQQTAGDRSASSWVRTCRSKLSRRVILRPSGLSGRGIQSESGEEHDDLRYCGGCSCVLYCIRGRVQGVRVPGSRLVGLAIFTAPGMSTLQDRLQKSRSLAALLCIYRSNPAKSRLTT